MSDKVKVKFTATESMPEYHCPTFTAYHNYVIEVDMAKAGQLMADFPKCFKLVEGTDPEQQKQLETAVQSESMMAVRYLGPQAIRYKDRDVQPSEVLVMPKSVAEALMNEQPNLWHKARMPKS